MLFKSRRASDSQMTCALSSESTLVPTSVLTTSLYWRPSTPQALRQQIARRIAQPGAKEEVAKAIANERLEFKTLWNRSLPINRLPYELLVYIFTFLHPTVTVGPYGVLTSSREISQPTLELMATCRLWRDVIVDTPAFWSAVVPECWNTKWTELCLSRSRSAPIEVWVRLRPDRPKFACPPYPSVHCIRRLHFSFVAHTDDSGKGWLFQLLCGTQVPAMPALEVLELETTHDERAQTQGKTPNDVNLTRQRLPCLRSLTLTGIPAPRDAALYADLHTLSLTSCSHSLSIDQFLDALALCTRLKTLCLHETLDRLSEDWKQRDPVPRRPLIHFPHLDSLEVSQHGSVCTSRFLSHIHVRASAQLEISTRDDTRVSGHRDAGASIFFLAGGMVPPNHAATLAPLATVTNVEVDTRQDYYSGVYLAWLRVSRNTGAAATDTTVTASMSMNMALADPACRAARRGWVRELVELLGRAPGVTALTLDNTGSHPDSVADWAAVFRAFPRLERLSVRSGGDPDGVVGMEHMFLGLHAAGSPAALACQHLREVGVFGLVTTTVYEAIRTCIVYRGRQGVVLEELDVDPTPCWVYVAPQDLQAAQSYSPLTVMLFRSRRSSKLAMDSESTVERMSILTTSQYWRQSTPQALRQQIARRIAQPGAKEEVAKAISNERLQFKTLWNHSPPINRLPYELLVYIFTLLHPCIGCYGILTSLRGISQPNLDLMATCRLWRDVIVDTPALWSVIVPEHRNAKWTELCLARSRSAPIEVWAQVLPWGRPDHLRLACGPPYPLVHRIRSLYFAVDIGLPDVGVSRLDWPFRLLFDTQVPVMPALEKLDLAIIYNTRPRTRGRSPDDVDLSRQRLPCLRSLTLSGIFATQDPALYADLRTLTLTTCSHSLSINQFLDALALCTRLETLCLHDTLERLSGDWAQRDPGPVLRRPVIHFPRLNSLEISKHSPICTSRFLAHIHVQASVQLEISTRSRAVLDDNVTTLAPLATVNDLWVKASGADVASLQISRTSENVVTARMNMNSDSDTTGTGTGTGNAAASPINRNPDRDGGGRSPVRALVEVLGHAPVTELALTCYWPQWEPRCPQCPTSSVADWAALFRAFPRLDRLDVSCLAGSRGELEIEHMFLGLHAASTSVSDSEPARSAETGESSPAPAPALALGARAPVACPHLRSVTVYAGGSTAVYEAVRTCIGYRGRQGVVLDLLDLGRKGRDYLRSRYSSAVCRACMRDIKGYAGRVKDVFMDEVDWEAAEAGRQVRAGE
ncbi:hypothetical protein GSI_03480 [Ganoderma sinense ZZ0214-1]|uniref:F-box domain-containing protein n=1 Tax=Ganoderma sinense ZZ0214-1 TaxID=1077348 RepID=A0A2G8SLS8_9APHY|nr:hypothetical protein GSI_03480 [Ganoderma sinense ZZ0214-1]